jgi:hypothetical protein
MSEWSLPIDIYCERTTAAFWGEPVNALTNAAFLLAAGIGWGAARRTGSLDAAMGLLIGLVAAIGMGSFLFHTFANRWAGLADILPIAVFMISYLTLVMRRFFGFRWMLAALIGLSLLPARVAVAAASPPWVSAAMSGSIGYLPAWLFLFGCGLALVALKHPGGRWLLAAAAIFFVSLTFRSLDARVCDILPLGTHFLWHLLNAAVLALLLVTFARHGGVGRPG